MICGEVGRENNGTHKINVMNINISWAGGITLGTKK